MTTKALLPISILCIIFFTIPIIAVGDFYTDFNLQGMECYSEKQTYEQADSTVTSAEKTLEEAQAQVILLQGKNLLGSPRKAGKHYKELENAVYAVLKAESRLDSANSKSSDAYWSLRFCIDDLICAECQYRGNHKEASCETCDATDFYSCKHNCPNIARCSRSGCNAKLETDIDKAYHTQTGCSCGVQYYLCDSGSADSHRPRICYNHDSYYFNGDWYYMYMGSIYKGKNHCNTMYRSCLNSTCSKEVSGYHNDYGAADGSCSICSYITVLGESCPLCNP